MDDRLHTTSSTTTLHANENATRHPAGESSEVLLLLGAVIGAVLGAGIGVGSSYFFFDALEVSAFGTVGTMLGGWLAMVVALGVFAPKPTDAVDTH